MSLREKGGGGVWLPLGWMRLLEEEEEEEAPLDATTNKFASPLSSTSDCTLAVVVCTLSHTVGAFAIRRRSQRQRGIRSANY